jgi:exosortase A-associated hydrolase 1
VLILVGGPQYRVGSHRQFVVLARSLAGAGHATLRFDYTGMGDSDGELRSFEQVGPDLRAGLDALCKTCPQVRRIVVWGLCDAASAALMFAPDDSRVAGIVAANPWARSAATLASTQLKHYYLERLLDWEFWRKLWRGDLQWRDSWHALRNTLAGVRQTRGAANTEGGNVSFQVAMARGLKRLQGPLLLILSGNDLTAKEFIEYAQSSPEWRGLLQHRRVTRLDLPTSDHTFSQRNWLDRVNGESIAWLRQLPRSEAA